MKNIFAPKELSKKLREIGFDEPCIAYYNDDKSYCISTRNGTLFEKIVLSNEIDILNFNSHKNIVSAPTWEQVFKWFRDRGYLFVIGYDFSDKKYNYKIVIKKHNEISRITSENYPTYEQARENLALELIKIYSS